MKTKQTFNFVVIVNELDYNYSCITYKLLICTPEVSYQSVLANLALG